MREILFRGKRIDNGEWVYGQYAYLLNARTEDGEPIKHMIVDGTPFGQTVDPSTVGQYTGLTDKNGKKIFEGDILRFGKRHLLVWWNCEAFQWQAKTVAGYDLIPFDIQGDVYWTNIDLGWIYSEIPTLGEMTTKVVGNIHDNPELMEE